MYFHLSCKAQPQNHFVLPNPKTQLSKYNELTLFGGESHMDRWKSAELNDITCRGTIVGLFGEYELVYLDV